MAEPVVIGTDAATTAEPGKAVAEVARGRGVTRRMLWARPSIPLFDRYQNRCHNDSVSYGHGEYLRPHRVLVSW